MLAEVKRKRESVQALKNSATIQGFADRSEAKLEENGLQGIFKKIQPISVGV